MEIASDWYQHIFGTKNPGDYALWLDKLQLSSSANPDESEGVKHTLLKNFNRDENYDPTRDNWFTSTATIVMDSNANEDDLVHNNKVEF